MSIPPKTNPGWKEIVTGKKAFSLKFLAAKILLGRLVRTVKTDPSPDSVSAAIDELHALYTKNAATKSAQDDIKTIFG
ncbi:hypothetical protein [Desulfogranum japonicum]|uniref:hypothetical protein n=1 Tax=Desulfogranum japonicum TaxID=231447 RepID=UPI00040FAC7C|nr:hypothetical protein [Desulfogranum japonicum]